MIKSKTMSEEITKPKLDTKLSLEEDPKTVTTKKLLFTDNSIERFRADFIDPKTNKTRYRRYKNFDGNAPKGLRICQYEKSKAKFFILQYWFQSKAYKLTIGEFKLGKFGVKEAQDKFNQLYQDHTNDRGIWIKNPKQTIKDADKKVYEAESIRLKKRSIREVIELIVKENFPSNKFEGNVVASTIKEYSLPMLGYNKRTLLMYFSNDSKGMGKIYYKGSKPYGLPQPQDSEDLFKRFPSGTGIIKTKRLGKYKNRKDEISLYDHDLSKHLIDDLKAEHVRDYINEKYRSYSGKRIIKRMFTYIWNYANNNGYISTPKDGTTPINITTSIKVKAPSKVEYKGARYNHKRFTESELQRLWISITKHIETYPFQALALLLAMVTGLRIITILKIEKDFIKDGFIELDETVTKIKREQKVAITAPVKWILNTIEEIKKKPKYQKYNFVSYLFPSTKMKVELNPEYKAKDGARLKSVRSCWDSVQKETGIVGAPKTFRKSYVSVAKLVLNESFKVMFLSGHTSEATLEVKYNKSEDEQIKDYANEVADKKFNFIKT